MYEIFLKNIFNIFITRYFINRFAAITVFSSSRVVEVIKTVLFFYQDTLHKNKTHKYLNTPKKHNKAHRLGDICPDKIADKKKKNFLFKNKM